jgi:hypothetical protein
MKSGPEAWMPIYIGPGVRSWSCAAQSHSDWRIQHEDPCKVLVQCPRTFQICKLRFLEFLEISHTFLEFPLVLRHYWCLWALAMNPRIPRPSSVAGYLWLERRGHCHTLLSQLWYSTVCRPDFTKEKLMKRDRTLFEWGVAVGEPQVLSPQVPHDAKEHFCFLGRANIRKKVGGGEWKDSIIWTRRLSVLWSLCP